MKLASAYPPSAFPIGGVLASTRFPSHAMISRIDELDGDPDRASGSRTVFGGEPPDPYADEPKYSAWKVTLFVILFCGAFWAGLSYLAMRLFG
jgi:hypothetical protein